MQNIIIRQEIGPNGAIREIRVPQPLTKEQIMESKTWMDQWSYSDKLDLILELLEPFRVAASLSPILFELEDVQDCYWRFTVVIPYPEALSGCATDSDAEEYHEWRQDQEDLEELLRTRYTTIEELADLTREDFPNHPQHIAIGIEKISEYLAEQIRLNTFSRDELLQMRHEQ